MSTGSGDALQQGQIDSLLASLRQAQAEVRGGSAPTPGPRRSGWERLGEQAAARLLGLLATAWKRQGIAAAVRRGPDQAALRDPSRALRLGEPLNFRLWVLAEDLGPGGQDLLDRLVLGLGDALVGSTPHQTLPARTPLPEDAVALPLEAQPEGGQALTLTLVVEERSLATLEGWLGTGPQGRVAPVAHASVKTRVDVSALEVEAALYVGGGVFRLDELASLRPGSLLRLHTEVGEPAILAIGGRVVAYGEVVVTADDTLALRLTRIVLGEEGRHGAPDWLEHGGPPPKR